MWLLQNNFPSTCTPFEKIQNMSNRCCDVPALGRLMHGKTDFADTKPCDTLSSGPCLLPWGMNSHSLFLSFSILIRLSFIIRWVLLSNHYVLMRAYSMLMLPGRFSLRSMIIPKWFSAVARFAWRRLPIVEPFRHAIILRLLFCVAHHAKTESSCRLIWEWYISLVCYNSARHGAAGGQHLSTIPTDTWGSGSATTGIAHGFFRRSFSSSALTTSIWEMARSGTSFLPVTRHSAQPMGHSFQNRTSVAGSGEATSKDLAAPMFAVCYDELLPFAAWALLPVVVIILCLQNAG